MDVLGLLDIDNYDHCRQCSVWMDKYQTCFRCNEFENLCKCCAIKCLVCENRFCSKCIVYPELTDSAYICYYCVGEPLIPIFIPNYYSELSQCYKDEIFVSLLCMKRYINPPKPIRLMILNMLFCGAKVRSDIGFRKCELLLFVVGLLLFVVVCCCLLLICC